jgi:diguanylate cyclase (GGDEF)-like protein
MPVLDREAHGQGDHHFACTLSSVLVRRVRRLIGEEGLAQLLERSGSPRTVAYLDDITNWISYDEAMALFEAAEELTGDPQIARRVGEETLAQHTGTAVATLMRSLGSPEAIYRKITEAGSKFSAVSTLEALEVSSGRAVIREQEHPGFVRTRSHCDWAKGLMSQPTVLFGLPPATVSESACQAEGADACVYEVTWDAEAAARTSDPAEHIRVLEAQLNAMTERLDSVYATATDLIADTDLDSVLARITERAATAVRAPRYLLALRTDEDSEPRWHQSGFEEAEAVELANRLLDSSAEELPASWLVAEVSSHLRSYGRLMAMSDSSFLPQERSLLGLYARYAASALDGATALAQAKQGHDEARALLDLARSLAAASTSEEVAARLVDAVPAVVDCDRVGVWLWDEGAREVSCRAISGDRADSELSDLRFGPEDGHELAEQLAAQLADPDPSPLFFDRESDDEMIQSVLHRFGGVATIAAPIVARGDYLGTLTVTVTSEPDRLRPQRDLLDSLSGVVAQAGIALQTARLVDKVTHQARHDALTGLVNRAVFTERIEQALATAEESGKPVGLLFVDLDGFKSVNDDLGHHAGDEVLRLVGQRLLGTIRSNDTVARLGGDEFAIVLTGVTDHAEVEAAAERVTRVFQEPFAAGGEALSLGASVGWAIWPADASEVEGLIRHADAAMYRAKRVAQAGAPVADG